MAAPEEDEVEPVDEDYNNALFTFPPEVQEAIDQVRF